MIYILSSIIDLRFTHSIKSETRRNESKFLAYFWHNFGIIVKFSPQISSKLSKE